MQWHIFEEFEIQMKFNFNGFDGKATKHYICSIAINRDLNKFYRSDDYSLHIHHVPTENTSNGKNMLKMLESALENSKLIFELQADPKMTFLLP